MSVTLKVLKPAVSTFCQGPSVKYILQQGALNTQKKRWMEARDLCPPETRIHFRIKSQWGLDPILSNLSAAQFATVIKARLGGTTWSHNMGPHCQKCSYPKATTEHPYAIWHCPAHLHLRSKLRVAVSEALSQGQSVNLEKLDSQRFSLERNTSPSPSPSAPPLSASWRII